MSISKKPGGGSFQSVNVRTAILFRNGVLIPVLRRPCLPSVPNGCQEPIDGRGAHVEKQSTNIGIEVQVAVPLHRFEQRRNSHLQSLPTDPVSGFPKDRERLYYGLFVNTRPLNLLIRVLIRGWFSQRSDRMFPVEPCYFDELVEDLSLLGMRGGVIPRRDRLNQFFSGCQTQLPPDSVARHIELRRVTFS